MFVPTLLLAVLDDPGTLAPGDVRNPREVIILEGFDAARDLLRDYNCGQPRDYNTIGGGRQSLDYMSGGEDPTLTLYIAQYQASRPGMTIEARVQAAENSWRELIADGDPYPDYQLKYGPRGGIVRHHC